MPLKHPKIDLATLPEVLPSPEAIKSFGMNEHCYTPEMWELEYIAYRYLDGLTDTKLARRYESILQNIRLYGASNRGVIPILSYQSCWYWYRKEHQTRLEFALRNISPPKPPKPPATYSKPKKFLSSKLVPNGTDILFRYGERKYMREMVNDGNIRFTPAENFEKSEHNAERRDEELKKHRFLPSKYTKVTTENGQVIPVIGDIKRTTSGSKYHLVCFSCIWDEKLFDAFEADTCVVVSKPDELARRIAQAGKSEFPNWSFHHSPVQYFDPYERTKNEPHIHSMSKDFWYAHQNEYRFLWEQSDAQEINGFQFVRFGNSKDIMAMYDIDGQKVH